MRSDDRDDGRYEGVVVRLPEPPSTVETEPDARTADGPVSDDPASDDAGPDDSGLWADLRAGDEEALRTLFVRRGHAVYNFSFRRTGSWSVAEDVAQSTFTTVWRRAVAGDLAELRLPSARPILFAFARKEAANQLRSARRQAPAGGADRGRSRRPGADRAIAEVGREAPRVRRRRTGYVVPAIAAAVAAVVAALGVDLLSNPVIPSVTATPPVTVAPSAPVTPPAHVPSKGTTLKPLRVGETAELKHAEITVSEVAPAGVSQ